MIANDGWEYATAYDMMLTVALQGRPIIGIPDDGAIAWVSHIPTPLVIAHLAHEDIRVRGVAVTTLAICAHEILPTLGVDDGS